MSSELVLATTKSDYQVNNNGVSEKFSVSASASATGTSLKDTIVLAGTLSSSLAFREAHSILAKITGESPLLFNDVGSIQFQTYTDFEITYLDDGIVPGPPLPRPPSDDK